MLLENKASPVPVMQLDPVLAAIYQIYLITLIVCPYYVWTNFKICELL